MNVDGKLTEQLQDGNFRSTFELSRSDYELIQQLKVPIPGNEARRLNVFREAKLLDTAVESAYDRYTALSARVFKVPIALISLVDVQRQWFKSKVGLSALETHRDVAFCSYTILENTDDVFVVRDALTDPLFVNNELVTGPLQYGFMPGPHWSPEFSDGDVSMLRDFGKIVESMIDQRRSKALGCQNDLARLNLCVIHSLRFPLRQLQQQADDIHKHWKHRTALGTIEEDMADELSSFRTHVGQLEAVLETGISLAMADAKYREKSRYSCLRAPCSASIHSLEDIVKRLETSALAIGVMTNGQNPRSNGLLSKSPSASLIRLHSNRLEEVEEVKDTRVRVDISLLSIALCSTLATYIRKWHRVDISCSVQEEVPLISGLSCKFSGTERSGRVVSMDSASYVTVQLKVEEFNNHGRRPHAVISPTVNKRLIEETNDKMLMNICQAACGDYEHECIWKDLVGDIVVVDMMKASSKHHELCSSDTACLVTETIRIIIPCTVVGKTPPSGDSQRTEKIAMDATVEMRNAVRGDLSSRLQQAMRYLKQWGKIWFPLGDMASRVVPSD